LFLHWSLIPAIVDQQSPPLSQLNELAIDHIMLLIQIDLTDILTVLGFSLQSDRVKVNQISKKTLFANNLVFVKVLSSTVNIRTLEPLRINIFNVVKNNLKKKIINN